jgi:hypothetical protein
MFNKEIDTIIFASPKKSLSEEEKINNLKKLYPVTRYYPARFYFQKIAVFSQVISCGMFQSPPPLDENVLKHKLKY